MGCFQRSVFGLSGANSTNWSAMVGLGAMGHARVVWGWVTRCFQRTGLGQCGANSAKGGPGSGRFRLGVEGWAGRDAIRTANAVDSFRVIRCACIDGWV